jgi:DNA-binding MarR family transcriptional regulator
MSRAITNGSVTTAPPAPSIVYTLRIDPSHLDRVEVRWSLTPAGRRRLARAWPAWEQAQERLRAQLRPDHWRLVVEDLAVVAAAAGRA